jgi:hypothetical protein
MSVISPRQRRTPETLTLTSHGLTANDVIQTRPISLRLSDTTLIPATTNDQSTQEFAGVAVQVVDANTVKWYPRAWFQDVGELAVTGGTLTSGSTYYLQTDGTVGTSQPGTGEIIPVLRANSTTHFDLDGDIFTGIDADTNTNVANTSLTLDSNRVLSTGAYTLSLFGNYAFYHGIQMHSVPISTTWEMNIDPAGQLNLSYLSTTLYPLYRVTSFNKYNTGNISTLKWENNKPAYCDSLTADTTLPTPDDMEEGMWMNIYLRGNASGYNWDFSNYDFGDYNDGSAFTPLECTSTSEMDRLTVQRCGSAYVAVWQHGLVHAAPT